MASLKSTTITGTINTGDTLNNTSTGLYSSVIGGNVNKSLGGFSGVFGGAFNCATGQQTTIVGGNGNKTNTGSYSVVIGGKANCVTGANSIMIGGCCAIETRSDFITAGYCNRTTSIDTANSQMFIEKVYVNGGSDIGNIQANYVNFGNTAISFGACEGSATINKYSISTPGNGSCFGSMYSTTGRAEASATSNGVRAVVFGGCSTSIGCCNSEYVTVSTPGNGTYMGTLTYPHIGGGATSNGVRGITGGQYGTTAHFSYLNISTGGNASYGGTLSNYACNGDALTDLVNGYWFGGPFNTAITKLNISTVGTSVCVGDLGVCGGAGSRGASTGQGAVISGSGSNYCCLRCFSFSTPSSVSAFGMLSCGYLFGTSTSNGVRAVFQNGNSSSTYMSYINMRVPMTSITHGYAYACSVKASATSGD